MLVVLERAGEVAVVGGQVEVAVAAEAEEDRPRLAGLLGAQRLVDRQLMAWVGSGAGRMPSLRAKVTAASKAARCLTAVGLDQAVLERWLTSGAMPW